VFAVERLVSGGLHLRDISFTIKSKTCNQSFDQQQIVTVFEKKK
jgi:hypothetical protein